MCRPCWKPYAKADFPARRPNKEQQAMPLPKMPARMCDRVDANDPVYVAPEGAMAPALEPDPAAPRSAYSPQAANPTVDQVPVKAAATIARQPAPTETPDAQVPVPAEREAAPISVAAPTETVVEEAPRAVVETRTTGRKRTRLPAARRKLFVLDTNVLLHDSN